MRRWALAPLGLSVVVLSCGGPRLAPSPPPPPPPVPAPVAAVPIPEWVPSDASLVRNAALAPSAENADGGVLAAGVRVSPSGSYGHESAMPVLSGGARVPARLGGGFLFWSPRALYFARTFTGALEPVTALESDVARASFGQSYVLLHGNAGGRVAFAMPSKQRIGIPLVGLIDVASAADGRTVALVEPNRVWVAPPGAGSWRDVSSRAPDARQLHANEEGLYIELASRHALRVEADGTVTELETLPESLAGAKPKRDPRWPTSVSESPRERALRRGFPVDTRTVLVEAAGAFGRVDAATGQLGSLAAATVAGPGECQLLPVRTGVLAVCRTAGGSTVFSGVEGPAPKVEHVFQGQASFYAGANGSLLMAGPCDGPPEPERVVVCVRQNDASWRELGEPKRAADAGPSDAGFATKHVITRWIPSDDGGALGLVGGEGGGIYSAETGVFTPFSRDGYKSEYQIFSSTGQLLIEDFALSAHGSIVGYVSDHALTLHLDGSVERSPHTFWQLRTAGPLALASDSNGRLWQSSDYGLTFQEVARPPGAQSPLAIQACSRAGCDLGDWYRIGFRATPPGSDKLDTAPPAAVPPRPPRLALACERTAAPATHWVTRAHRANGELAEQFDYGARKVPVRTENELVPITLAFDLDGRAAMRGATLAESLFDRPDEHGYGALATKPRSVRFTELFGEPKVVESRFAWADVFRVAGGAGNGPPSPVGNTDRMAVPVLGANPGTSDGMLMFDDNNVSLWLRAGRPARVVSLGDESPGFSPVSAAVRQKDELVVLSEDNECAARISSITSAGARVLSELPRRPGRAGCALNPDALGFGPDGALGLLRVPSRDAPDKDDPVLFVVPGRPPVALAPFSTLTASESCPADPSPVRALVRLGPGWLGLSLPGNAAQGEPGIAVVRWGRERVCLEAVEVAADSFAIGEQELATRVMARFVKPESAVRRGFALGAEHVENLACKLAKP